MNTLSDILTQHTTFLLDASGVIYNDYGPFKKTPDAIKQMQKIGHVFVVTNNSFNSPQSISERLASQHIDIPPSHIISSGHGLYLDADIQSLLEKKTAFVYGSEDSHYYVQKANVAAITDTIKDADIIIMTASYAGDNSKELTIIQNELHRRPHLAIVCCNPDKVVMSKRGLKPVIGHFAERLETLNNATVHWVGKPLRNFNNIVKHILEKTHAITIDTSVCFFDDNIENVQNMSKDIGISSCWVKNTGIFKDSEIAPLTDRFGRPDYIIEQLASV
jgi:HAD superfamily hydrolase (TIGR01450 family)